MRSPFRAVLAELLTISSLLSVYVTVYGATGTNLAMPDLSDHCLNAGSTFTTALTASSLANTQSWQVNITFTAGQAATLGYALGTPFSGQNTFTALNNSTSAGYFLLGWSAYNGRGPVTSYTSVTLVTFTWKTLVRHATVLFHIVTSAENSQQGTMLLDPNLASQSYTTTDGFLGCQESPGSSTVSSSANPSSTPSLPVGDLSLPEGSYRDYAMGLQVLPANNYTSDIALPGLTESVSWGFEATGLLNHDGTNRTWNLSTFGAGVKIAVLDTGVNGTQLPDLQGQVCTACYYNPFNATEDQYDHEGHGTAMAAIIAAKHDNEGIVGIAYRSQIYSGKVLDRQGNGNDIQLTEGINWAVSQGVNIISMSLGGAFPCPADVQNAVNAAVARGIILLAAAGNAYNPQGIVPQTYDSVTYPANCVGVFPISSYGVTAGDGLGVNYAKEAYGFAQKCTDFWDTFGGFYCSVPGVTSLMHGEFSEFSYEGPEIKFAAPGSEIWTWVNDTTRGGEIGTSPATAFAAGLLALGYSRYGSYFNPGQRLWQMTTPVFPGQQDSFFGYGLLNGAKMLTHDGDVNGDGVVNIVDLVLVAGAFGQAQSFRPAADINWDGRIDISDLSSIGGKFGRVFPRPPSKDVWGPNLVYNPFEFGNQFWAIMGECGPACPGDSITISATVNPNIASYVTGTTILTMNLYVNQTLSQTLLTLPGNAGGQTFSNTFSIPRNSFWQIQPYLTGAYNYAFGSVVYDDFSLANTVASESWGLITCTSSTCT